MGKRDLLRKANAGNAQKRGTEAVLNEEPTKVVVNASSVQEEASIQKAPIVTAEKPVEVKEPIKVVEEKLKTTSSLSSKITKSTKNTANDSSLLKDYTGPKTSKSIMLSKEDNIYLIKEAAKSKKPIQDVFAEIMANEIKEVSKGNIDQELADEFLVLRANNMRRNVSIPQDLIAAIDDTAALIPLKSGKFIQYALYRARA